MSVSTLLNACESGDLETITSILNPTAASSSASSSSSSSSSSLSTANTASLQHTKEDSDEESDDDDEEFAPEGEAHHHHHHHHEAHSFYRHGALKPSTESRDRWKITPLGAAIMGHQLPAIQLLLSLGANANGVIEHSSLLHYACAIGGIGGDSSRAFAAACVAQLLTAGARTDALDEFDRTPLHIAGASGLHESIPLLLAAAGTSHHVVDHQDNRGQTALHVAARNGHHTTVSALLVGNADKDITDHRGRTAAHHAAEVHDAAGMALCASEDPHVEDGLGRTASAIVQALEEGESTDGPKGTDGTDGTDGPRRKPTLIVFPHPCVEHKTAVSIARGKMEPPPENEQRIHVLVDANIGTLRAAEFNHRVVWDEASPRASLADILRVHDHLYVNMVKTRCEGTCMCSVWVFYTASDDFVVVCLFCHHGCSTNNTKLCTVVVVLNLHTRD